MTKGRKTGGRDFKKGMVANPNGRPRIPDELKKIRKMNRDQLELVVSKYFKMTLVELNQVMKSPETTAVDLMICQIIVKAIQHGDHSRLNALLDRVIGKVKDHIVMEDNPHRELMALIRSRTSNASD